MFWIHADRAIVGDGTKVLSPVWIGIEGENIAHVTELKPEGLDECAVLCLDNVTLIPGIINIHDHISRKTLRIPDDSMSFGARTAAFMKQERTELMLYSAHNMKNYLIKEGITFVRDYGLAGTTALQLDRLIRNGIAIGPEIQSSADPICITGGHCYKQSYQADGVSEVMKAVRVQAERGAKIIKFMCSGGLEHYPREIPSNPEFSQEELSAGVAAAKDLGLPTAIHAYSTEAIQRGIIAGVNNIEHGALMTEAQVEQLAAKGMFFNPTMSGLRAAFSRGPNRQYWDRLTEDIYSKQEHAMRLAHKAGVLIGAGTDSMGFMADEIRLIGETLGETPVQAIAHATGINAKIAGRNDLGLLEEGKRANIAAFYGDLTSGLEGLSTDAALVIKDGIVYKRPDKNDYVPFYRG